MLPLRTNLNADDQIDAAVDLRSDLEPGTAQDGVTTYLAGQPTIWAGFQELSKEDLAEAEMSGFPIVAIILLVVFGSLAAAALPLALGFVSVIVTGALIYFISLQMSTSVFVTNMASMIGIGVAIDYSLFILARYREERRAGRGDEEALAQALSTSGLAVTFSGLAVIVSLAGLWMVDNQALRSMALGAMTVVAVSILTATTLLPTLISFLGDRVMPGGVVAAGLRFIKRPFRQIRRLLCPLGPEETEMDWPSLPRPGAAGRTWGSRSRNEGFWVRWTRNVMAHPWVAVVGVTSVLLAARGAAALDPDRHRGDRTVPEGQRRPGRQRTRLPRSAAAPIRSRSSPASKGLRIARRSPPSTAASSRRPGVSSVSPPAFAGESVLFEATSGAQSESDAARALVGRLRDTVVPSTALAQVATVDVGGETARSDDVRAQISGSMWKIVLFVLSLSFLVLMVMLRSLLLPLKAVLMNLLSIGAAFGILVAIFQWGWFDGLLGFESQGALDTINVPLIFAIVFGLSMDYEVFLMSRIRERYMQHHDNERAVAEGLSTSARTISSAALIMTSVFAVFVLTGVPRSRSSASAPPSRSRSTRPWSG